MNIDCFAGGGGASTGLEQAGVKIDIAINHDPAAILMHKTNHPDTLHLTEDIFDVDLSKYLKPTDRVDVMWASPDCTSHSRAKGSQPRESGLRILPWSVYRLCKQIKYITGHLPKIIFMENVEEIQKWCPLDENGKPEKNMTGICYECFISAMTQRKPISCNDFNCLPVDEVQKCEKCWTYYCNRCIYDDVVPLGFDFASKELIAADYGAPTTRKRWYAVFRSDGKPIKFPEPTHNRNGENGLEKWVPVSTVIDWSDLGKSIFDRKKPLADTTQKRIANGIRKFIVDNPHPFIVPEKEATAFLIQYHGETSPNEVRGQGLDEPIQTIDTSNRYALVTAFITKFYKTGTGQSVDEPLHTITTSPGHFGLVSAFLVKYYGGEEQGQAIDRPLDTITTKDRFGLVNVVFNIDGEQYVIKDIFLRMLKPRELMLAQGFPSDYIIYRDYTGAKYPVKEQVARIGNSVVPAVARAIAEVNLKEGVKQ